MVLACVPTRSKQMGVSERQPPAGYIVGRCEKCDQEIWIGPRQQAMKAQGAVAYCMPCSQKYMIATGSRNIVPLGGDSYAESLEELPNHGKSPREFKAGEEVKFDVRYPSGRRFSVYGSLQIARISEDDPHVHVFVLTGKDHAVMLDSRAIVTIDDCLVYHPRWHLNEIDPGLRSWVVEHPDW
jgi:hypothetical protein